MIARAAIRRLARAAACVVACAALGAAPVAAGTSPGWSHAAVSVEVSVAMPDAYSVLHDHGLQVDAPGVLGNDVVVGDPDPDVVLVKDVLHGNLNLDHDGSFRYRPDDGYVGTDFFTYGFDDGIDLLQARVSLDVTNTKPVARADAYTVTAGDKLTVKPAGVLENDTDGDGDSLVARKFSAAHHGTLSGQDDGSFEYIPDAGYVGKDTFNYHAWDGIILSTAATVTITVKADTSTPPPTPAPTPAPTAPPTPTPTPAVTPPATPTPAPTRDPDPDPTATAIPTATPRPTPTPSPLPTQPPTPSPSSGSSSPGATQDPGPVAIVVPGSRGSSGGDGTPGSGAVASPGTTPIAAPPSPAFELAPMTADGGDAAVSVGFDAGVAAAFDGFSWQVPALVISVPGMLVVVAVGLQVLGGLAWLPVIRRRLGGSGVDGPVP